MQFVLYVSNPAYTLGKSCAPGPCWWRIFPPSILGDRVPGRVVTGGHNDFWQSFLQWACDTRGSGESPIGEDEPGQICERSSAGPHSSIPSRAHGARCFALPTIDGAGICHDRTKRSTG